MKSLKIIALGGVLALSISCGQQPGSSLQKTLESPLSSSSILSPATGNFRLVATDAPFTYDTITSAKITLNKIVVRQSGGSFTTVMDKSVTLDLVNLKNGLMSTLADLTIAPGQYDMIQLHVSSASVDLKNGKHFDLNVPSGAQTGVKVFLSPVINVVSQVSTDLLLDFDLSRSFLPLGNTASPNGITGFNFFPVIRAANLTTAGSISGKVLSDNGTSDVGDDLPFGGAIVEVKQGTTSSTAVTGEDGVYKIIGLPAGDYEVSISAEAHTSSSSLQTSVAAGNLSSLADVLLKKEVEVAPVPENGNAP